MKAGDTMLYWRALSLVISLTMVACAAASAQTVTIDAEGVPLNEVIDQLKLDADVDIRTDGVPQDVLMQPVTYTGADLPIKRALREIGRQAGLRLYTHPGVGSGGRWFRLLAMRPDQVEPPMAQAGPYLVRLARIKLVDERTLDFGRVEPLTFRNELELSLQAEADTERDAAVLLAIHPALAVTDNTGHTLEPARPELDDRELRRARPAWEESVFSTVSVGPPAKDAVSLAGIAGELVVAAKVTPVRFELDPTKEGQEITQHGYTLRLDSIAAKPQGRVDVDFTMTWQLPRTESGEPQSILRPVRGACAIVLDDGTEVRLTTGGGLARAEADGAVKRQFTCRAYDFPAGAKPARVTYSFFVRSDETKRIPFKLENIPLPTWEE
jgi:hypothetical protein